MRLKLLHIIVLILLIFAVSTPAKRSRGRSRGSSGSSNFWNRKGRTSSGGEAQRTVESSRPAQPPPPPPKPVQPIQAKKEPAVKKESVQNNAAPPPPKPSAPVQETPIKKTENNNLQQNSRPIGWNVDGTNNGQNVGFKTGPQNGVAPPPYSSQNVNPSHGAAPPPYSNHGYGAPPSYPGYNAAPGVAPPAYPGYGGAPGYGAAPPGYSGYGAAPGYPHAGGYNPQQPFPGYYPTSNIGVIPPRGANAGHYYNSMSGYGNNPVFYNQQNSGFFGGKKHGYGGFGGYGGYGSLAGYGYGMKKSGGFFGKNAFRNVLGGLFIWYMISGLTRKPYNVYNYYNQPAEEREEMTLPANLLTLCNENVTTLCVPGTYALCTTNNSILCVASMNAAAPCTEDNSEICVTTKIPCEDPADALCQNKTTDNTTAVDLPCFTNLTLDTTQGGPNNIKIPYSEDHKFCVTTMAVPDNSPPTNATIPDYTNTTAPVQEVYDPIIANMTLALPDLVESSLNTTTNNEETTN